MVIASVTSQAAVSDRVFIKFLSNMSDTGAFRHRHGTVRNICSIAGTADRCDGPGIAPLGYSLRRTWIATTERLGSLRGKYARL